MDRSRVGSTCLLSTGRIYRLTGVAPSRRNCRFLCRASHIPITGLFGHLRLERDCQTNTRRIAPRVSVGKRRISSRSSYCGPQPWKTSLMKSLGLLRFIVLVAARERGSSRRPDKPSGRTPRQTTSIARCWLPEPPPWWRSASSPRHRARTANPSPAGRGHN